MDNSYYFSYLFIKLFCDKVYNGIHSYRRNCYDFWLPRPAAFKRLAFYFYSVSIKNKNYRKRTANYLKGLLHDKLLKINSKLLYNRPINYHACRVN